MAYLLMKKLSSLNPLFLSCGHRNLTFLTPLLHFSTQVQQKEDLPFMAQYLISSFGFSRDRALRVARHRSLSRIRTQDRPDSVVCFYKDSGLKDTEIKSLILWHPQILTSNVEKTLKRHASELIKAGFAGNMFIQLIKCNPMTLLLTNTVSRLQFWRTFVGNNEEALLKVIKRNPSLLSEDINKKIIPKINLLHEYGLSDQQIYGCLTWKTDLMCRTLDNIKLFLKKTEDLGFQRGSGMFVHGLSVLAALKEDTIQRKIKLLKNIYGWSEEDVNSAIKKSPFILAVSEDKIMSIMDFLTREVGFEPSSVSLQPVILTLSLKRRLIPRHYVINMLNSKGLINRSLYTVIFVTEKKFVEKFIVPYKEEVPELADSYAALCDGRSPY